MKYTLCGTALAAVLTVVTACSSVPNPVTGAPEPAIFGIGFTTGNSAKDATLINVGQRIDAGILTAQNIEQTDLPALCALGAKFDPLAQGAAAINSNVAKWTGVLDSVLASPSCTMPATGTLADGLTLAQSIRQISVAIKQPAATVAAK